MYVFKHLKEQPFVLATAVAALIHSTWSLGVLFAGHPPAFEISLPYFLRLAYWLVPALLIAIALDVGQVSTATSIRRKPTAAKYVTFGVFAVATYYLQWSYMLYHMPNLTPSNGIAPSQLWLIEPLRNLALWIIPSLLPLSTTLYTLSSDTDDVVESLEQGKVSSEVEVLLPVSQVQIERVEQITLPTETTPQPSEQTQEFISVMNATAHAVSVPTVIEVVVPSVACEHCGKSYQRNRPHQKYCSPSCRTAAHQVKQSVAHR